MATSPSRPKVEYLTPNQVHVDPIVQRDLDHTWVKKLVNNWDDRKIGVIEVSRRDDGYYVSDGQHRLAALIEQGRGDERLPMHVVHSSGRSDEALRFVARNAEVRRPNPVDVFRVELAAGEPVVVEIDKVLQKHGLVVSFGHGPGYVAAVSALRKVHRKGGVDLLDRSLGVILRAWGKGDHDAFNGTVITGIATVLHEHRDDVDEDELATKLAKASTPGLLIGNARSLAQVWSKSLAAAMAEKVLNIYNARKRSRRVLT